MAMALFPVWLRVVHVHAYQSTNLRKYFMGLWGSEKSDEWRDHTSHTINSTMCILSHGWQRSVHVCAISKLCFSTKIDMGLSWYLCHNELRRQACGHKPRVGCFTALIFLKLNCVCSHHSRTCDHNVLRIVVWINMDLYEQIVYWERCKYGKRFGFIHQSKDASSKRKRHNKLLKMLSHHRLRS